MPLKIAGVLLNLPQLTALATHIHGSPLVNEAESYSVVRHSAITEKNYRLLPVKIYDPAVDPCVLLIVHDQPTDESPGGKFQGLTEKGIGPQAREWITATSGGKVDGSTLRWKTVVVQPVTEDEW